MGSIEEPLVEVEVVVWEYRPGDLMTMTPERRGRSFKPYHKDVVHLPLVELLEEGEEEGAGLTVYPASVA